MTQDEIIEMAREAGGIVGLKHITDTTGEMVTFSPEELERFAALVAASWIETNKALAKEIIELKKQAEQEPVAVITSFYPEGIEWFKCVREGTKLYATPVRTKDLTDDDLRICFKSTNTSEPLAEGWPGLERFARAVIAADREKNK